MFYIYKLTWGDHVHHYIGCAKNAKKRYSYHVSRSGFNHRIIEANKKYGKPEMVVLEVVSDQSKAGEREQHHINTQCATVSWMGGLNNPASSPYPRVARKRKLYGGS